MNRFFIVLYSGFTALAAASFIINLGAYRKSRQRVGEIKAHWRVRFNFAFPENWLILALVLGYLAVCAVLLARSPASVAGYHGLVVLAIGFSFFPRFNFVDIGSKGILDRWIFIPWEAVSERWVVEDRGRRRLELRIVPAAGLETNKRTRSIRVPRNVSLVLD
jgi:hypothetical protein